MNINLLTDGLHEMGIKAESKQIELLEIYYNELNMWNKKLGLVNARGDELIIKHILDSLSGLNVIRDLSARKIADIGSGG